MKKALVMLLLLVAVFGAFGIASADPTTPKCEGPVDLLCKDDRGTETTADDRDCTVYVSLDPDPAAVGILCENPPAA